jgi:hypothetical protein
MRSYGVARTRRDKENSYDMLGKTQCEQGYIQEKETKA